ncbi:cytochrome P450 hydroxylase [Streptomyces viridochromogenes DSM 40736]|uniref:Cytochrome P450 hydroxylase n=1 Tax=Streptomyces viridochromogenes (strain DSM 40736 / JCM 4977 / BCRC 1201 / Tue 494) TaxID=591159 RepID=D9X1T8_STRVT|nr:cytochrome P450 hydroxylase [Streptomyces viridochromogenes DSM 40736]
MSLARPVATLDPNALDVPAEGEALRRLGHGLVPVALPGAPGQPTVRAWAVTDHDVAKAILDSKDFAKSPEAWEAYPEQLPEPFPLLQVITAPLLSNDGSDHRRLRSLISKAFTARRVDALRGRVEEIAQELLVDIPTSERVDLRRHYARPLPIRVISELFGLKDLGDRERLADACDALLDSHVTKEQAGTAHTVIHEVISGLIERKRHQQGDDLTSALIRARDDEDRLSHQELHEMLFLLLIAGMETTQNLIVNGALALLDHPAELSLLLAGVASYATAVSETLRYDSPLNTLMFYFAVRDVTIGEVTVCKGEAVLFCLTAIGRDPHTAPDPDVFRLDRPPAQMRHLSFSYGPHYCLGAQLAQMEAEIALRVLFTQRTVTTQESRASLPRMASLSSQSAACLPVQLADWLAA